MNREGLAWAAGFVDGEGSFGVQRQLGHKPILYLQAGQVDRAVLDKLQTILNIGKVYGPYLPRHKNDQPYHYFRVTGNEKTIHAAKLLWEWLSLTKREQYGRSIRKLATETVLKTVEAQALSSSTLLPTAKWSS